MPPTVSPSRGAVNTLKDAFKLLQGMEKSATGATVVPRVDILNFKLLPVHLIQGVEAKRIAYKVNALRDLYYFSTVILGKDKLQRGPKYRESLHYQMCLSVMKDGLKEVIEIPRDHYKSTIYSECFPIWRALPFSALEQDLFASLGHSDLFIEWMRRTHDQDIRILLVSETITNATMLGVRISQHYENGELFREVFPELSPTSKEIWTANSLHQNRTNKGKFHGEGTFDFIGVGAALQSRHYNIVIQDDLVGKDAISGDSVMKSTIEYHQLLVGAMDADSSNPGRDFDEIVVGNRWSHKDLNSYIRDNESYFNFTTHSALGGCCALHPIGVPIFPEAFSAGILLLYRKRLGSYFFSCQFLNFPIDPAKAKFNMGDFRFFHFEQVGGALANPKIAPGMNELEHNVHQKRTVLRHHVVEGDVINDVYPRYLERYIVVDPNHGGTHDNFNAGRCRHAIMVSGVQREPRRVYILDTWAEACPIEKFVFKIFEMALKWKLTDIHVEAVGAQKFLLYHMRYYIEQEKGNRPELQNLRIVELKASVKKDAKTERIDGTVPLVERHEIWLNATGSDNFREEAEAYGQKKGLIDLLDVFGYSMGLWKFDTVSEDDVGDFLAKRLAVFRRGVSRMS
jgi:hypothetical protein